MTGGVVRAGTRIAGVDASECGCPPVIGRHGGSV